MIEQEDLRIAPSRNGGHWTIEDWKSLDFDTEQDWQTAIDIFEDRIRYRFLKVVDAIEQSEGAGFAVMALDCLLIETLQQFYEGVAQTPQSESWKFFRDFLTQTSFGESFDETQADLFYGSIRNGILHQAETKASSRIWTREGARLVSFSRDGKGLLIHRRLFHQQLESEFKDYVERLRQKDAPNEQLRKKFKTKMDAICRVGQDE